MEMYPLELRRVADHEWIVYDGAYPLDDSRSVVACLTDTEDDLVDVVWLQPTPLPTVYLCAADVLEDVARHRGRARNHGRPDEIPHFPPLTTRPAQPRQAV
ncbi:hypothetical protein [Microbacterium sp. CFBP9034]|uniref:hypothetical protein n=1 Tax=Microbacterium sp. CFBP9034 TaxID=3096540 RepID=UPI002A6ADFCF|nr:hypothetical protein [Microbacterium sp. CFBP9034]MDY0908855.1 hypothetical protein [Microbacterium sp. CFBP9034]